MFVCVCPKKRLCGAFNQSDNASQVCLGLQMPFVILNLIYGRRNGMKLLAETVYSAAAINCQLTSSQRNCSQAAVCTDLRTTVFRSMMMTGVGSSVALFVSILSVIR